MESVKVTALREGDIFAEFTDSRNREVVTVPRADIRKVLGLRGKEVRIVHQEPPVAECKTQPNYVHLSTSRGVWCVNRETVFFRD